jgi:hypothetical protein
MSISLPLSGPGTGLRFNADGASCGWNMPDAALERQYSGPAFKDVSAVKLG